VEPGGLPQKDAIDRLLAILNDEQLVIAMNQHGAKRHAAEPRNTATAVYARQAGRGLGKSSA
jgi:hypothetical protein